MSVGIKLPEECVSRATDDGIELSFQVPANYPYFAGHFPGNPIVPGVCQVGWASAAYFQLKGEVATKVGRFRFLRPVKPEEMIVVTLVSGSKGVACTITAEGELASKGTLNS